MWVIFQGEVGPQVTWKKLLIQGSVSTAVPRFPAHLHRDLGSVKQGNLNAKVNTKLVLAGTQGNI